VLLENELIVHPLVTSSQATWGLLLDPFHADTNNCLSLSNNFAIQAQSSLSPNQTAQTTDEEFALMTTPLADIV